MRTFHITVFCLIIAFVANSAWAQVTEIRDVHLDANGDFKPDKTGEIVTVEGQVTMDSGALHGSYLKVAVQDATGGLFVFNEQVQSPVSAGDMVRVTGRVSQYNGLLQLVNPRLELTGKADLIEPRLANVSEIQNETFEGMLVRVTGKVIHKGRNKGGEFFILHEAGDVMMVFRGNMQIGVSLASYAIGDQVRVTGIVGQWDPQPPFNSGYQIYTRDSSDIVRVGIPRGYYKRGLLIGCALFLAVLTWVAALRREVKRETSKLVDTQERLRAMYAATIDSVVLTDSDMIIIDANPAVCKLVGIDSSDIVGRLLADFLQFPQGDSLEQMLWPVKEFGSVRFEGELLTTSAPQPVDITINTVPIAGREDLLVVARDISSHKQQERALLSGKERLESTLAELRETQDKIVQQERLSALGQMASGIAHDFNNALQSMLGFAEIAIAELDSSDEDTQRRARLDQIMASGRSATDVVKRLREFYRKRETDEFLAPADINSVLRRAKSITQPKWMHQTQAKGINIRIVEELGELPIIAADSAELQQVFTNLIFNAVDAMPQGGTITLRSVWEGDYVRVEVADSGIGMSEDVRQRCLEPFFSTKGDQGTGLGLAIVYGTINRHGGKVEIESAPGKGCAFVIHLPASESQAEEDEPQPAPSGDGELDSFKCLVIDDDPLVLCVIDALLRSLGQEVVTTNSGQGGLEALREQKFDIVITDRSMPEISGDQVAEFAKQNQPDIHVIMISGFGDTMQASGELPNGVDNVLSKPVSRDMLAIAVAKHAEGQLNSDAESA
ncbi:MAG: PAS domain S-box-containing protein [Rhodothermales bacterium]|jgi:PAS domain S-box-containing protein